MSNCSAALSPSHVRSGPIVPPRPFTTWQARQPFWATSFLAWLMNSAPFVSRSNRWQTLQLICIRAFLSSTIEYCSPSDFPRSGSSQCGTGP